MSIAGLKTSPPRLRLLPELQDESSSRPSKSGPGSALTRDPGLQASAARKPPTLGSSAALFLGHGGPKSGPEAFQAAVEALRGVSSEGVSSALAKAGFEPALDDPMEPGRRRFRSGRFELAVESSALGLEPALLLELSDRLAKKKHRFVDEAVAMGPAILGRETFDRMKARFTEEMARFASGLEALGEGVLPSDLEALKALGAAGQSAKKQKKEAADEAAIALATQKLTARIDAMKAQGQAPKGIIVYVEGPDGAGKTSTGAIVMRAIEDAGYKPRSEVFKAPTEAERKQHWLQRFERGVPKKGEVVFWDRGPAGDAVYGKPTAAKKAEMGKELVAFERALEKDGVLLFKLELFASESKQADTFGKRLARQAMAAQLQGVLAARGGLDAGKTAGLANIAGKIDADDFRALETYQDVQASFLAFVGQSGPASWNVVDATKRHDARLEIMERFEQALSGFVPKAQASAA